MMKANKYLVGLMVIAAFGSCVAQCKRAKKTPPPVQLKQQKLQLRWQRLVGQKEETCERCKATEQEVQKAFPVLSRSLAPLGIKVSLSKDKLDSETFARDVSQSNRIWIGEKPIEKLLEARVGKSACGACCEISGKQGVKCRTLKIGKDTYEVVPASLIVRAGLIAASELIVVDPAAPSCKTHGSKKTKGCC
jgi:hypothetical protein